MRLWQLGVLDATQAGINLPALALLQQHRIFGVLEPLNSRLKFFLMAVFAAVLTAATLRHIIHTYGGFTREEIRIGAIVAIAAIAVIAFAVTMLRRKPRR